MRLFEFEKIDIYKLDDYLAKLCSMIKQGQKSRPEYYGMVAAGILTPKGRWVAKLNYPRGKLRVHAERAAIEEYNKYHGKIPEGSIMVTTLSPCNESDDDTAEGRLGPSCTDLINSQGFKYVYCGFKDPTQDNEHGRYKEIFTKNKQLQDICGSFADSFLEEDLGAQADMISASVLKGTNQGGDKFVGFGNPESGLAYGINKPVGKSDVKPTLRYTQPLGTNSISANLSPGKVSGTLNIPFENFADGRHPEDKGDSSRYGIPKHASISTLRKIAHQGGRKGQLAHWQANMRSGHNK